LTAQHPTAIKPYLHYASPRLRRDAKAQTSSITNQFHVIMSNLHRARYQNALELQTQLSQAEQIAADATARCELVTKNANIVLAEKQRELDSLLTLYSKGSGPQ
jgi:phage-related minor tail protein